MILTSLNITGFGRLAERRFDFASGLNVDLDVNGEVVGFDIDFASKRSDLSTLETFALPVRATDAA